VRPLSGLDGSVGQLCCRLSFRGSTDSPCCTIKGLITLFSAARGPAFAPESLGRPSPLERRMESVSTSKAGFEPCVAVHRRSRFGTCLLLEMKFHVRVPKSPLWQHGRGQLISATLQYFSNLTGANPAVVGNALSDPAKCRSSPTRWVAIIPTAQGNAWPFYGLRPCPLTDASGGLAPIRTIDWTSFVITGSGTYITRTRC
jgi:hypothetical protein